MASVSQTTFSNAFSWTKMFEFQLTFDLFTPKGTIDNNSALVQPNRHYLNQWSTSSLTHICITRPQWVKLCSWLFQSESSACVCSDLGDLGYLDYFAISHCSCCNVYSRWRGSKDLPAFNLPTQDGFRFHFVYSLWLGDTWKNKRVGPNKLRSGR